MSYRFLIVNTDYGHFLEDMYRKNPQLSAKSFDEQYSARMQTLFGMNDFYSANLRKLGHQAIDLIYNNRFMQYAWAMENGLMTKQVGNSVSVASLPDEWLAAVFKAQVKMFRPDVIVNLAMEMITSRILNPVKPDVRLIIGQHAAPFVDTMEDLSAYDLLVSSIPHYVTYFQKKGKKSEYFKLGFESTILDKVQTNGDRPIDIAFVGGFSVHHSTGADIISYLADQGFNMALYGYGQESLSPKAQEFFGGGLYGKDMYELYSRAKIVINRHIDISGEYANNMRLYEAAGMGALLITDSKKNLGQIFNVGSEVTAYRSKQECAELVRFYLEHDDKRKQIASNGQKRILSEHTYYHRMSELTEIVDNYFHTHKTSSAKSDGLSSAEGFFLPPEPKTVGRDLVKDGMSLEPVSRKFGFDRGTPIDRYYIEKFLDQNKHYIHGRVLEIADNSYTRKYGSAVTQSDVLNAVTSPNATIVGDLANGKDIPESAFDCIILTQTIQFIYDVKAALRNAVRALKPGGTLLLTAAGISQISRYDMERWGEYWRFTDKSLKMLLSELLPEDAIHVEAHGNVAVAKAFLDGLALHEIDRQILDCQDNDYQVLLTARVCKMASAATVESADKRTSKTTGVLKTPLVLLYHRVAVDPIDSQLLAVSPANFEGHLKELAMNYKVIPLTDLLQQIRQGELNTDTIALTFDDGYADNLTNALPLLEKYNLPATIFVTAGVVNSDREFWWDALERIFLASPRLPQCLAIRDEQGILSWSLLNPEDRLKAWYELSGLLRVLPAARINQIIEQLLKWAGIRPQARSSHRILNREQLIKLASSPLIRVGSHTMTHTKLDVLSHQEQLQEICESKQVLESVIRKPVQLFSYPYGTTDDFTDQTRQIIAQQNYLAGIANIQGNVTAPVDMYSVPRRLVRDWPANVFIEWLKDPDKQLLESKTLSIRDNRILAYLSTIMQKSHTKCLQVI